MPAYSTSIDGRVRRSRGSDEWQTAQVQPIVGTPMEVPLPSTVSVASILNWSPFLSRELADREPAHWLLRRMPCAAHKAHSEGNFLPLGSIKQKGGKTVHAWAFEADLPPQFELKSNTFSIEFPSRSGKFREFPEVDRAEFFPEEIARRKINPGQIPFLDRLRDALDG